MKSTATRFLLLGMVVSVLVAVALPPRAFAETGLEDDTPRERWARMLWANITNAVVNSSFPFTYTGTSSNSTNTRAVDGLAGAVMYLQTGTPAYLALPEQVMVWLNGTATKKQVFYPYNTSIGWEDDATANTAQVLGCMATYAFLVPKWRPLLQTMTSLFISRFVNATSTLVYGQVDYDDTVSNALAGTHTTSKVVQALTLAAVVLDNDTIRDAAYNLCMDYPLGAANLPYHAVYQNGSYYYYYCKEDETFGMYIIGLSTYSNYFPNDTVKARLTNVTNAFYTYGWNSGEQRWNYLTNADTGAVVNDIGVHGFGITDEAFLHAYLITGNATLLGRAKQDMVTMITNSSGLMQNGLITHSTTPAQNDADDSWNVYARRTFNIMYNLDASGFYRNATLLDYANDQFTNASIAHQRVQGWQKKVDAASYNDFAPLNHRIPHNLWLQYVNRTDATIDSLSDLYANFGMPNYGNMFLIRPYVFMGAYWEDTGVLTNQTLTVTVYYENLDNTAFSLNGTYTFTSPRVPLYFHFAFPSPREYWVTSGEENGATIRVYNGTLTAYTVAFLDTTNVLDANPYITLQRLVNGVWRTVEQRKVDAENKIVASLETGERYTLIVNGDTSYTYGELVATSTTAITLTLKGVDFPKDTLLTYKYVRIYATRAFAAPNGNITVTYQDTLTMTTSVLVCFNYKNGTNAYNTTQTASSFIVTWSSAVNATDYRVAITIVHQRYGTYSWSQYFAGALGGDGLDIGFLGGSGLPFDTGIVIPVFLILFAGGCFTVVNSEVGALFTVFVAALLVYIWGVPIAGSAMVVAASLAVVGLIIAAKRRVQA